MTRGLGRGQTPDCGAIALRANASSRGASAAGDSERAARGIGKRQVGFSDAQASTR
jgi:hypothetical protein